MFKRVALSFIVLLSAASSGLAQEVVPGVGGPEVELCRVKGLAALKESNTAVKELTLDLDSLTIAKANIKIEDIPVRTIIIGDAYLEKGNKETRRTLICLIGEKEKVLMTFFTEK
jgi:hypothetical protein